MRTLLVLFAAWVAPCALVGEAAASEKPNIVYVLFDDMGYGEPGCYRADSDFKTPNIDRLAREGMRFTDAHSAGATCTPTRYGLITGRYPFRAGIYGVLTSFSPPILPKDRLNVATLLKQNGYDTACIGKWHLGMDWGGQTDKKHNVTVGTRLVSSPNADGFDSFYGYTHARNIGTVIEQDKVEALVKDVETQPRLAEKVVAFLDAPARKEKPFFLYIPLCPPHHPTVPAPEFAGKGTRSGKPNEYGDWLYQGDHVLGQVIEALERHHLADNTLLIVTSDNGAANRPYPPLRGAKTSIYEGGHRMPFVARWPGTIKPGSVCHDTICLNDLMATCADILDVDLPANAGEDSVSILPQLLGKSPSRAREYVIHQSAARDRAIRQGPWKLIFFHNGKRELYNLDTDISEKSNVLDANPDVVTQLTALMKTSDDEGRSTAASATNR
jgi:arylsulfatase A-like enzyme